jgi:hypothetical protein
MRLKTLSIIMAALTLTLTACASALNVQHVNLATQPDPSRIYYALPFAQFKVTITRRVVQCTAREMKIEVKAAFERQIADDTLHAYTIDPASMRHLLNTAKFDVTFFENTNRIQTINASVQDQTAAAARHLIPAIGKMFSVSAGAGALSGSVVRPCSSAVVSAVHAAGRQRTRVERATRDVQRLTAVVTELRTRRASWGAGENHPNVGRLGQALGALEAATENLARQEAMLTEVMRPITWTNEFVWPDRSTTFDTAEPMRMDVEKFRGWHNPDAPLVRRETDPNTRRQESDEVWDARTRRLIAGEAGNPLFPGAEEYRQLNVYLRLAPTTDYGLRAPQPLEQEPAAGLRYRSPAMGRLLACASRRPTDPVLPAPNPPPQPNPQTLQCGVDQGAKFENEVGRYSGLIPQLGYVQTLPIRARALESASYSATFNELGGLAKAGYEHTGGGAAGAEMLGLALTAASDVRQAEINYENAALTRERDRAQALQQIAAAEAAIAASVDPVALQTSALNAETALLRAQIAREEAQRQWAALNGQ